MTISGAQSDREHAKFLESVESPGVPGVVTLNADGTSSGSSLVTTYDYVGGSNLIYYGRAVIGSSKAAAVWQIKKYTYSGTNLTDAQYAGGNSNFSNVWNDRATLSYS